MGHVVARRDWGTLDIDTHEGRIFLQQDWQYHWLVEDSTVAAWTIHEKRLFHNALDRQIWGKWSMRIKLKVEGTSDFARRFASAGVPINFDVHWVLSGGQWRIDAYKLRPGGNQARFDTRTNFSSRIMYIASGDLFPYPATNPNRVSNPAFIPIPHEFGHGLGAPDENRTGQSHLNDPTSIMNIGKQIRSRHLKLVLDTLNAMIPHTAFSAPAGMP